MNEKTIVFVLIMFSILSIVTIAGLIFKGCKASAGDNTGAGSNKQSARDTAERAREEIAELRAANQSARRDNKRAKELIAEAKAILGTE